MGDQKFIIVVKTETLIAGGTNVCSIIGMQSTIFHDIVGQLLAEFIGGRVTSCQLMLNFVVQPYTGTF
jgi:hypothetical protein